MAHGTTKRDAVKANWEQTDFPIVCETCLGDCPFVRMTKSEYDKECKVCARPFTVFRWKPGAGARYKKTEICQVCSKLKNVCQVCLLDLEYGLPTQVRDSVMANPEIIPQSDVNREFYAEQAQRRVEQGQLPYGKAPMVSQMLTRLARNTPYYQRNRSHICSFFVKGECNRGDNCPYRHELPPSAPDSELAQQNIKDRFYGNNDPVAKKLMNKYDQIGTKPPEDQDITTLWIGGVNPSAPNAVTEQDLRDKFYSFGEIRQIRMASKSNCAFLTFVSRQSAEDAMEKLHRNLNIKGHTLKLSWGRTQNLDPQAHHQYGPGSSLPTITPVSFPGNAPASFGFDYSKPYYPSMDPNMMGSKPLAPPPINPAP